MSMKPIPAGFENVIPFLVCTVTQKVIDFAAAVFGAKVDDIPRNDKGTIMHATIHIRTSAIMLCCESEQYPAKPVMLYIYVDNVDEVYKKGIDAGAESLREPTNEFYGDRSCGLKDIS